MNACTALLSCKLSKESRAHKRSLRSYKVFVSKPAFELLKEHLMIHAEVLSVLLLKHAVTGGAATTAGKSTYKEIC